MSKKNNNGNNKGEHRTHMGNPNHLDKIRYTLFYLPDKMLVKLEIPRGQNFEKRFLYDYKNYLDTQFYPDIRIIILEKKENKDINPVLIESEKKIKEDNKKRSTTFNLLTFPHFLNALDMLLLEIKSPDLFHFDENGKISLDENNSKKYIHMVESSFDDVILSPHVATNNDDEPCEGILVSLIDSNGGNHDAILSYDELYSLVWVLKHSDINSMTLDIYLRLYFRPVDTKNKYRR